MPHTQPIRYIDDINVKSKIIFYRADLNVPMHDGVITDKTRITRVVEGMKALVEKGARLVVTAHYGRPKGQWQADMSLQSVAGALGEALGQNVTFVPDCIGDAVQTHITQLADGEVVLLENLRFHEGEEAGDKDFAGELAKGIDIYVNDAFSASHRRHASIVGLACLVPAYAGRLMAEELNALKAALGEPKSPVTAIVGGAKVSTKLQVLNHLLERVDYLIIGGGMANTFLLTQGFEIGASLAEADMIDDAKVIMAKADDAGCKIVLPSDVIVAKALKSGAESRVLSIATDRVADDEMILDAGPDAIKEACAILDQSHTLIWNGPMGAFETSPFDRATIALAKHAAGLTTSKGLVSVAGGGDTVAALVLAGVEDDFHYVSTAGGAFLEWMEGKSLPGVAALMNA